MSEEKKNPPIYILISCGSCVHASKKLSEDPCYSCDYYENHEPRNPECSHVSCRECKHAPITLNEYPCSACFEENDESILPNFTPA